MENKPIFYDIVKKYRGGLVLRLPAYDSSVQDRVINFKHNVEKIRVPRIYALGIYIDNTLLRMYQEGYFSIEPADVFLEDSKEINSIDIEPVKIYSKDEILKQLKSNNRVFVKNILKENDVNRENIITIVRENIDTLPSSLIKDLEKILAVKLTIEEDDEDEE